MQIRGRSGLAIKSGILAHVGTLDAGFRGEACAILYNNLHKSKSGFIKIHRITGDPYSIKGYTEAFGEGIALHVKNSSEWWTTSNITYINWEEGWFDTLNSKYNFTFEEDKNEN